MSKIPQNIEAEVCTIGSCILDRTVIPDVQAIVTPMDFYRIAHQHIFAAIRSLYRQDSPIDIVMLKNQLEQDKKLKAVGGIDYVIGLVEGVPSAANAAYYAQQVAEAARRRLLIQACETARRLACEDTPWAEVVPAIESVASLACERGSDRGCMLADAMQEALTHAEQVRSGQLPPGLMTGFEALDGKLGGLQAGELWILAGDTGRGKTTVLTAFAIGMAKTSHAKGLLVSGEMTRREMGKRFLQAMGGIRGDSLKVGSYCQEEWQEMQRAMEIADQWKLWLADHRMTPAEIAALAQWCATRWGGIDYIAVDYLQLMPSRGHTETERVSNLTLDLKDVAQRMGIPVIALAQFNRERGERHKPPSLLNLKGSSTIEQTASVCLMLWGDPRDTVTSEGLPKLKLAIEKSRDGDVMPFGGKLINLEWDRPTTRILRDYIE